MSDYSAFDRLLHRFALGSPAVADMLHDLERARFLKSSPPFEGHQHVFVTGLARAGTTLLMRELFATGQFGSLTYADMPFVLSPNSWHSLSSGKRKSMELKERAHGDGVQVNVDSPEALDEVYWRLISDIDYIGPKGLRPHVPASKALDGYRAFIQLVLRRTGKTRYLSKNNNNLLRLDTLAKSMPNALFLVPIRRPLQHAGSMLSQHHRFLDSDAFTQKYMTWLAHHEFGATHRPYLFGDVPETDPRTLNYWLATWINAHQRILEIAQSQENIILIPYDDFCSDPAIWNVLLKLTGLESRDMTETRAIADRNVPEHDSALSDTAAELFGKLRGHALSRLNLSP